MLRAFDEFIIEGVNTTIPLFKSIFKDPNFIAYNYDTNFIEKREEIDA